MDVGICKSRGSMSLKNFFEKKKEQMGFASSFLSVLVC